MDADPNQIDAVKTSVRVVNALADRESCGVTELGNELGLPKSTVYTHLSTLVDQDLVIKSGDQYRLSLRYLEIGGQVRSRTIFDQAKEAVNAVADDLNELVNLMIEEDGIGVYLYSVQGDEAIDLRTTPGRHKPLNTTALGKAIMSQMGRDRVEEIIERHGLPAVTERTITDRDELLDQLDVIRERGYARDKEENLRGVSCIAVPIVVDQNVYGALSVSATVSQMESPEPVYERLRNAANRIEVTVEYG